MIIEFVICCEQECGCRCESCVNNNSIHLHREIEHLKRQLAEREYHIMSMESQIMLHARRFPNGEMNAMQDSLHFWQEKYERFVNCVLTLIANRDNVFVFRPIVCWKATESFKK